MFKAFGVTGGLLAPSKTTRPEAVAPGDVTIDSPVMSWPLTVIVTEPNSAFGALELIIATPSALGTC